jgi:predicted lipid-binding transport protein (Tim44 family)
VLFSNAAALHHDSERSAVVPCSAIVEVGDADTWDKEREVPAASARNLAKSEREAVMGDLMGGAFGGGLGGMGGAGGLMDLINMDVLNGLGLDDLNL